MSEEVIDALTPIVHAGEQYVIVSTGEGAQTMIVRGEDLHQSIHGLMCSCEQPWEKCEREDVPVAIGGLDIAFSWTIEPPTYKHHRAEVEGDLESVFVYRVTDRPIEDTLRARVAELETAASAALALITDSGTQGGTDWTIKALKAALVKKEPDGGAASGDSARTNDSPASKH